MHVCTDGEREWNTSCNEVDYEFARLNFVIIIHRYSIDRAEL